MQQDTDCAKIMRLQRQHRGADPAFLSALKSRRVPLVSSTPSQILDSLDVSQFSTSFKGKNARMGCNSLSPFHLDNAESMGEVFGWIWTFFKFL